MNNIEEVIKIIKELQESSGKRLQEILEENREQDWDFEDYMADVQHEQMMIENEGDYFRKC